jgi:Zn-dependent protease with chaperone function
MRLDGANRRFVALATVAGVALSLASMGACLVLTVATYRVSRDGPDALRADAGELALATFLIVPLAIGAVLGVRMLARQIVASRRLARRVARHRRPLTPALAAAADRTKLTGRVRLIADDEPFSFAYGALTPRVVISTTLVEALSVPELDAVLAHERYHVRNLDPLKVGIARSLAAAVPWLPALGSLRSGYVAGRELAADRHAVRAAGRTPLASALLKVAGGPRWVTAGPAAAMGGSAVLEARVAQLESGRQPPLESTTAVALGLSLLGALAMAFGFAAWPMSSG